MSSPAAWPYALTLVLADGERSFRFRIDPAEPERPFGREGNPLRTSGFPPAAGVLVAERLIPWSTPNADSSSPGYWSLPDFHEVSAIARFVEPRLGRLCANRNTFTMPARDVDLGPLEVLAVRWSRWSGEGQS